MNVSKIHKYPDQTLFKKILAGQQLLVASPFFSGGSISMIETKRPNQLSFITRLPNQYIMPSNYIDNDPKPLLSLMKKMENRIKIYALPSLHAKLYIHENSTWVGSSNFSKNGFSGKQELMLEFDSHADEWANIFNEYVNNSVQVTKADIEKLVKWLSLRLTEVRGSHQLLSEPTTGASATPLTFEDFLDWLADPKQPQASRREHILERVKGKNYMSGHVPPAFNGTLAFLRMNKEHMAELEKHSDTSIPANILKDFATFVKRYGDNYRGTRGGYWRRYLSQRLGGHQKSGGAGDIVVKKCLVLIPDFIKARQ